MVTQERDVTVALPVAAAVVGFLDAGGALRADEFLGRGVRDDADVPMRAVLPVNDVAALGEVDFAEEVRLGEVIGDHVGEA